VLGTTLPFKIDPKDLPQTPCRIPDFRPFISPLSIDPIRHSPTLPFFIRQRPGDDGIPAAVVRELRDFVGQPPRSIRLGLGDVRDENQQVESGESGFEVKEILNSFIDGVPR